MAQRNDKRATPTAQVPGTSQHNDWGHRQAGAPGNGQSGQDANIGGAPGGQHNDWGHSPVEPAGKGQAGEGQLGNGQAERAAQRHRQGVMPGEEMGHLHPAKGKRG